MPIFITCNKKMQKINQLIERAAGTDTPVLLMGEKGVGKDRCAMHIHNSSRRSQRPFILLSSDTFESYKHKDADSKLLECFAEAEGGTLYINDISVLNVNLQKSMIGMLPDEIDEWGLRMIVSSRKALEPLVKKGTFSEQLYHKLCVMQIRLPSLRERKEDVPLLIHEFVRKYCEMFEVKRKLSNEVFEKLSSRSWPGNIAELESSILYAFQHAKSNEITMEDLPIWSTVSYYTSNMGESLNDELYRISTELLNSAKLRSTYTVHEEFKKLVFPPLLKAALDATKGNKSQAAQLLGINRNTLKKILKDYECEN